MTDPLLARKVWRTLEPVHGFVYFSPEATAAYDAIGLPPAAHYFASRAAAMGPVPAEVVMATFYNFEPSLVRAAIPDAWDHATPAAVVEARLAGVDAGLRRMLGDDVEHPEVAEAAELAVEAAAACTPEGRPLHAAHAALPWPDEAHLRLWQAVTVLREHRGDGHLAALVVEGLDGCEALVTHGASGEVPAELLQATRGWSDEAWAGARQRLTERGLLDGDGFTDAGAALRQRVEDRTDEAAVGPWAALGAERCERLRQLVRPRSRAIVASGAFG